MTTLTAPLARPRRLLSLTGAATAWFIVASFGQLLFAAYVIGFYGRSLADGEPQRWNAVARHLYNAGDTLGNTAMGGHVLLAVVVLLGGALQLTPWLRRTAPAVHRWVGRAYLVAAAVICVSGLYLVWVRGAVGDLTQHIGITMNAVLVLTFGTLAWRAARARRFDEHRVWALRLYLTVAGVWFFRLSLMTWLIVMRAPVGFDPKTFSGPLLSVLSFAQTLVPLAVLELVLRARASRLAGVQHATALGLVALTLLTAAGIVAAFLGLWWPRLR